MKKVRPSKLNDLSKVTELASSQDRSETKVFSFKFSGGPQKQFKDVTLKYGKSTIFKCYIKELRKKDANIPLDLNNMMCEAF